MVLRGNTLVGPGEAEQQVQRNGLQLDWACGTSNREVVVETNAVVQWFDGLKMDENRDTYVKCNRFQDNRIGVEFYRGGASADPEVRLKRNQLEGNDRLNTILVEQGMESFALGSGTSTSDRGLNKIVVDDGTEFYVTQNDGTFNPATQFLHAQQNHWFDGASEPDSAAVVSQCEPLPPSTNRNQIRPTPVNFETPGCVPVAPSLSPGEPGAGTVPAGRSEATLEDGARDQAPTASATSPKELPARSGLVGLSPNPGRGDTVVRFAVGRSETKEVRIAVYDVTGRLVAQLVREMLEPGWREISWSGLDAQGKRVGAGVYFVRFEAGEVGETRKIVHLR